MATLKNNDCMKIIKTFYLFIVLSILSFGCSKSEDGVGCEENETTKVTFKNTGSSTLRVEMATQFDAQFNPVNPVFTFDLAPGTSSVREFRYGNYFIQWKANCSSTCTQQAFFSRNFVTCQEYQETQ